MMVHVRCEKIVVQWLLVVGLLAMGCGGGGTEAPAPASTPSGATGAPAVTGELSSAPIPTSTTRGVIIANRELRMNVSGPGAGHIDRALEVLELQIIALLPGMRDAYDRERAQEPALMGSLDVSMTIEPSGAVSDIRFPVKRVSNERLTVIAFDHMRTWVFPAADLPVLLRFSMLFIPPGIDESAILLWEKRLGSRPVVEKGADAPAAPASAPTSTPGGGLPEEVLAERRPEVTPPVAPPSPAAPRGVPQEAAAPPSVEPPPPPLFPRWYRVAVETVLRAEPREYADVVRQLKKGTRVRVVGIVRGRWLEVHSVSKRPPGFLWWEDAIPETENTEPKETR